jgi:hypothetical protein
MTTTGETMSRQRRPLAALAVLAVATVISACGSGASGQTGGAGNANSGYQAAVKFAECIRANGVSQFPDPNASGQFAYGIPSPSSPLDPSSAAWQKAIGACRTVEPSNFMPTSYTTKQIEARLKFAQCVRDNGVPSFPDPQGTGPLIDVKNALSIPGFGATIHKCILLNPAAVQ